MSTSFHLLETEPKSIVPSAAGRIAVLTATFCRLSSARVALAPLEPDESEEIAYGTAWNFSRGVSAVPPMLISMKHVLDASNASLREEAPDGPELDHRR